MLINEIKVYVISFSIIKNININLSGLIEIKIDEYKQKEYSIINFTNLLMPYINEEDILDFIFKNIKDYEIDNLQLSSKDFYKWLLKKENLPILQKIIKKIYNIKYNKIKLMFDKIDNYNNKIIAEYNKKDKIDFSRLKKKWGREIIPENYIINPDKKHFTLEGNEVINLHIILKNSNNKEVTFPVKGTILRKKWNKDKTTYKIVKEYSIWTIDGRNNIKNNNNSKFDLVEIAFI